MDKNFIETFAPEDEQPLERWVKNGGYTKIFRKIACIGDSLSSGEFESLNDDGTHSYHDMFEYSWGQYLARTNGCEVYNFSRGGMTAKEYFNVFADEKDFWNPDYRAQAYIIALGVNDINCREANPFGSVEEDIDFSNWRNNNTETFVGSYAAILQRYREMQPRARFFLMTLAKDKNENWKEYKEQHRCFLYTLSEHIENCYVIDLLRYAPDYDEKFQENFYLLGHLNPMGYVFTAEMVSSYIDYIIRHHMQDFRDVSFIGTDLHD